MVLFSFFFIEKTPKGPNHAIIPQAVRPKSEPKVRYIPKCNPSKTPSSRFLSSRLLLRFLLVSTAQRLSGHTPLGKSDDVLDTAHEVG